MLHDKKKLKEKFRFKNCNFRLSWFIIYSVFVLLLSAVGVILLFTLQMFQHTHFLPIFLLVVLYSFSIIMFAFMITPFFDKSRVSIPLILFCYFCVFFFFFIKLFLSILLSDCRCAWQFRSHDNELDVLYSSLYK